jgi:hypothetical protein
METFTRKEKLNVRQEGQMLINPKIYEGYCLMTFKKARGTIDTTVK